MIWITRDGRVMRLSEMTDRHLANAIAMIEKKLISVRANERAAWGTLSCLQGEMSQYYAEQDCNHITEAAMELEAKHSELLAEQRSRKMRDVDYSKVPVDYMRDGVRRYIEHGIAPGHFLTAVFSNDLKESFKRADDVNLAAMRKWVAFMYWEMPVGSYGSPQHVEDWCKQHRLAKEIREDASDA